MSTLTLDQLSIGSSGKITKLNFEDLKNQSYVRRLMEMGFLEGASFKICHHGFWGKDPIAVRIRGTLIALRKSEAECIEVSTDLSTELSTEVSID